MHSLGRTVLLLSVLGGTQLFAQRDIPVNPPADNPDAQRSYALPLLDFVPPATQSLDAPEAVELSFNQSGFHRELAGLIDKGEWSYSPSGERTWRLTLRSPGARLLRLHVTRFDGDGALSLYSVRDNSRVARYSEARKDFWTALIPGDTVALDYRPANPAETRLPFQIDRLAHGAIDPLPTGRKGCESGDLTCEDAAWNDAGRAAAYVQSEREGFSYLCTGWLVNTRTGSRQPYLVTASSCLADANSATAIFRTREQREAAALLTADDTVSLLKLESAPESAYFLGWTANAPSRIVPLQVQRAAAARTTEGELRLEDELSPTSAGAAVLSEAGEVSGILTSGRGGAWLHSFYETLRPYLEDAAGCDFEWRQTAAKFPASGGDGGVEVETRSGCRWSASSHNSWIGLASSATLDGTGAAAFRLSPNASRSARTGAITVAGRKIVITQDGLAGDALCQTTPIEIGAPLEGEVAPECLSQARPGRFARRFRFQGQKGQPVVIAAESRQFDPQVYLLDATNKVISQDDDGGDGTSARIPAVNGSFRLPYSGSYTIELTSANDGGAGVFRLAACPGQTPIPIAFGQTLQGQLTTSSCINVTYYTQLYSFQATAGQQIAITMGSTTLDSFLVLNDPSGQVLLEDDDSGGSLNSRIPAAGFYTLPFSGTYVIEASHWDPQFQTGAFTLSLALNAPTGGGGATPLKFVAVTPCRVMDTRTGQGTSGPFGPPSLSGAGSRDVPIASSACGISSAARAYSLNVTVVPQQPLSFLSIWPAGVSRPNVSTLNSFDGRIVANAAIVPAGTGGAISVYATDNADVIIDINGYFIP